MSKGAHFIGQPMYGQLLNLLDKSKILRFSRECGGERYVKHFDAWQHLVIMLYAVISASTPCVIWVTLIANLLLMHKRIRHSWSFSNLAIMFRIMLMYYVNCHTFNEEPEKDWVKVSEEAKPPLLESSLFD